MVSVLGTLISAVVVQVFGILFEAAGYVPSLEVQPEAVKDFLNVIYILVPSICFVAGGVALKMFPVNKKTFKSLQKAVEIKRQGGDWSMYEADIRKIIG